MGIIVFEVTRKGQRTTKNLSRALMWYEWAPLDKNGNPLYDEDGKKIHGTMHKLQGGRLDFKYDSYNQKLAVGTAPVKITSYETESNSKEIDKWIDANSVELKLTVVSGVGITVTFPDDKKKAVKSALEDTNFTYEIV